MDNEIRRELTSMEGERKMGELALIGHQNSLASQLNGSLGQDMKDVLEGRKTVEFTSWRKIRNKFDKLLWTLGLGQ